MSKLKYYELVISTFYIPSEDYSSKDFLEWFKFNYPERRYDYKITECKDYTHKVEILEAINLKETTND